MGKRCKLALGTIHIVGCLLGFGMVALGQYESGFMQVFFMGLLLLPLLIGKMQIGVKKFRVLSAFWMLCIILMTILLQFYGHLNFVFVICVVVVSVPIYGLVVFLLREGKG
ncbi:MAG: hypothetical protein FWD76_00185 [Firmicutes bacterium]|nr:hypothetical protein [Bacillota bacterium]